MTTKQNTTDVPQEEKKITVEIDLPSGKKLTFIKDNAKGKDIIKALAIVGENTHMMPFALAAQIALIDGQKLVMEDFEEMDAPDVLAVMKEISSRFLSAAPSKSSTSATQQGGDTAK